VAAALREFMTLRDRFVVTRASGRIYP
jgi:hypothetical protein